MQFTLRNCKNGLAAVAIAGGLLVGGGLVANAQAVDVTATPREAVQTAIAEALGLTLEEMQDQLWAGQTLADLADAAGIDVSELRDVAETAQQAQHIEQIQAAVEAGDITQEQADWMIEGIEQGYLPAGPGRGGFGMDKPGRGARGFGGHDFGRGMGPGEGFGAPGMRGERGFGLPFGMPDIDPSSSTQQPAAPALLDGSTL